MKKILFSLLALAFSIQLFSQKPEYKVGAIGFYNFENLFDTLDTPNVRDTEFTPKGKNLYTPEVYQTKLDNLSGVIAELGTELTPDGLAILGVCEIENRSVLEDLVVHPNIADRAYKIVHYDSADKRGIDVGLIYQEKYYKVEDSRRVRLHIMKNKKDSLYTRDILLVSGLFDGEPLHVLVNHWPSRSGGEARSRPLRNAAAKAVRHVIDSLEQADPAAKVILMGDLNDDPNNESLKKYIRAKRKKEDTKNGQMFNPMYDFYKKGIGTTAWRDAWSLFDQILVSPSLLQDDDGYFFYKARIYNKRYLVQKTGRYKGYPFRTYSGGVFTGGYSDHFPVFIYLVKEKK